MRAVETFFACHEAIRLIDSYEAPAEPSVPVEPRSSTGHGCTEAPRGILYHRYTIDDSGLIRSATIVPPTAQNQPRIEADLRAFVEDRTSLPDDELTWQCEQAIRNYDPCISCATHFLDVRVKRVRTQTSTEPKPS